MCYITCIHMLYNMLKYLQVSWGGVKLQIQICLTPKTKPCTEKTSYICIKSTRWISYTHRGLGKTLMLSLIV